jgi:hypothetical protein
VIDKKLAMPMAAMNMMKKKNNAPNFFDMMVSSLFRTTMNRMRCHVSRALETRIIESQPQDQVILRSGAAPDIAIAG